SWIVVSYLIATTVAAPVYGKLRDTIGGRTMMLVALSIFVGASIMCATASTMEALAFFRILQGIGGGGLMTLSQALIGETVPPRQRAKYQGYLAVVAVTSSTLGPIIGGLLTDSVGWRSVFLINLPVGLLAIALALRLPSQRGPGSTPAFDWKGLAYFVAFIVPFLLAVEQIQTSKVIAFVAAIALVGVSIGSLILLIRREQMATHPLFELELLKRPAIWRSDALTACHGATLVSLVTFLPIYIHVHLGVGASRTGLLLLPLMFGIGLGSMITGRLVARTGLTMIFPSFGLIATVLLILLLSLLADRLGEIHLLVLLFFIGGSMGTVMGVVQVTVQTVAGSAALGAAAALVQLSRSLGASIGTAVVGAMLFATLSFSGADVVQTFQAMVQSDVPTTPPRAALLDIMSAFRVAFFTIALFASFGLALAWSHPQRRI
ncbi:MAG: MFS transporter, partial [Hyphomicrobiaceae bacterium]